MKFRIGLILLLGLCAPPAIGQAVDSLLRVGVAMHDRGAYDSAVTVYEQALGLDPNSALVHTELAMTLVALKEYERALPLLEGALQQEGKHLLTAYMVKGSALDYLNRTDESIAVFQAALKKLGAHHLLYFNMGLDYYRLKQYVEAEEAFINAIQTKSSHASSHLLLGYTMIERGEKSKALLALDYFLLLEPRSGRSPEAYQRMRQLWTNGVEESDKRTNITIQLPSKDNKEFGSTDMMIPLLQASRNIESNKGKTDMEFLSENTKSLFTILSESKKKKHKGFWWEFYTPFFKRLADSPHMQAYTCYISSSTSDEAKRWLEEHGGDLKNFADWMNQQ